MFPNAAFREHYLCLLGERDEAGGRVGGRGAEERCEAGSDRCTGRMKSEQRREGSLAGRLPCDREERRVALK